MKRKIIAITVTLALLAIIALPFNSVLAGNNNNNGNNGLQGTGKINHDQVKDYEVFRTDSDREI